MDIYFLLFDGFETLDLFGPVEILGQLESTRLHYISLTSKEVTSAHGFKVSAELSPVLEPNSVLLIPGGFATRTLVKDQAFLDKLLILSKSAKYVLTVCTGSALVGMTGQLDGKEATSNKRALDWVRETAPKVKWKKKARWVKDGKFYTASGISAGMDMALGFVSDLLGYDEAREISNKIEYIWNEDPNFDLFSRQ